jgi:hypothetical protein
MLDPSGTAVWYSAVYYLIHSWMTILLVGWAAFVVAIGIVGLALADRDPAP